jgi:hypothetical protein
MCDERLFRVNRITPQMRVLAATLMAHEASNDESSAARARVVFRVCEQLRPHLVSLMGSAGCRALLARAFALAMPQVPWLASVQLDQSGSLQWPADLETRVLPAEIAQGATVLVAQLLGLLTALVGEALTMRIVRQAWPELRFTDGDSVDSSQT